ncbi:MAG TPA: RNA-binding S4 domain-containing protein [Bacillota bacterium]|nr:RNA-binding S4 domain-containing protein [Bacillota bacterium]HOR86439.1 RNA-binding S4 domain-containing protein [Bacillota bacterium]
MRLDKYLKNSRLIKRRTVAKEACESGKIYINGKPAKPGTEIKVGDLVELILGEKNMKVEITDISDTATKIAAREMFRVLE